LNTLLITLCGNFRNTQKRRNDSINRGYTSNLSSMQFKIQVIPKFQLKSKDNSSVLSRFSYFIFYTKTKKYKLWYDQQMIFKKPKLCWQKKIWTTVLSTKKGQGSIPYFKDTSVVYKKPEPLSANKSVFVHKYSIWRDHSGDK